MLCKTTACCPFHNERNPSFKVYEDHYHCFGCGEHGDHVDFVQKLYGVSNIEAAKKISHDFGLGLDNGELAIPVKPRKPKPRKDEGYELWLNEATHVIIEYKKLLDYGEHGVWVRPAEMWNETIEKDGKSFKRFERCE